MGVSGRRQYFEDAFFDTEDGDILKRQCKSVTNEAVPHTERATPQIIDQNLALGSVDLVEPVGKRGGCRFVDDA